MKQLRKATIWSALGVFALASIPQLASAATLNIAGCDQLTIVDANTISCTSTSAPPTPGAPTGCKVTPSSVTFSSIGGSVTPPPVTCTSPTTFSVAWTKSGAPVTFPDPLPENPSTSAKTYSYSAAVCDGALCTTVAYTATVAAGAVVPPPPPGSCGNLKVITPVEEKDSSNTTMTFTGQRYLTSGLAGVDTIAVAKIVVPADISGLTTLSIAPWGVNTTRRAWLSQKVCDTSATAAPFKMQAGGGPTMNIQIGGAPTTSAVQMQPGETWYLMVKNEQLLSSKSSCLSGNCDIGIKLYHP